MSGMNEQPKPAHSIARPMGTAPQPALTLNDGIGQVHDRCIGLRDRLDTLAGRIRNAPTSEAAPHEPAANITIQEQLVVAIEALGEANVLLDGIVSIIGYEA